MKRKPAAASLAALITVVLGTSALLSGCGGGSKGGNAAKVNNQVLSVDQFNDRLKDVDYVSLGQAAQVQHIVLAGQLAMYRLLTDTLFEQLGAEKGVKPTDADVTSYVNFAKKYNSMQAQEFTLIPFDPVRTDAGWVRDAKVALIERGLALKGVTLSPQDLQSAYDVMKARLHEPDRYHLRLMALSTRQQADQAIDTLKKGIPFDVVAQKMSVNPGLKANGGDIGIVPVTSFPAPLRQAVTPLKAGQFTTTPVAMSPANASAGGQPIGGPTLYYLAQVVEMLPGRTPPLEEVKQIVEWQALQTKDPGWAQRVQGDVLAFKQKAKVDIYLKGYEQLTASFNAPTPAPTGPPPTVGSPGGVAGPSVSGPAGGAGVSAPPPNASAPKPAGR